MKTTSENKCKKGHVLYPGYICNDCGHITNTEDIRNYVLSIVGATPDTTELNQDSK